MGFPLTSIVLAAHVPRRLPAYRAGCDAAPVSECFYAPFDYWTRQSLTFKLVAVPIDRSASSRY